MGPKLKWFLIILLLIPCWVIGAKYVIDLPTLYRSVKAADLGQWGEVYSPSVGLQQVIDGQVYPSGRFFYPPFALVIFGFLGFLPFMAAKWVWLALQTACFFLFWRLVDKLYPFLTRTKLDWLWIVAWVVAINPVHNNFQSNNIQLLLAGLLFGGELLSRRNEKVLQFISGILVMMAVGIKVYPLFMAVYFLLMKRSTVRAGLVFGTLLITLLPFGVYGIEHGMGLYHDFYANVTTYGKENGLTVVVDILSFPSMVARYLESVASPAVAAMVIRAGTIFISAIFFWTAWRAKAEMAQDTRLATHFWALALALMTFLTPSTRPHYFIFYVPAFISLGELAREHADRYVLWISLFVSVLLVAFTAEGVVGKVFNDQLEGLKIPVLGMTALCLGLQFALASRCRRRAFHI